MKLRKIFAKQPFVLVCILFTTIALSCSSCSSSSHQYSAFSSRFSASFPSPPSEWYANQHDLSESQLPQVTNIEVFATGLDRSNIFSGFVPPIYETYLVRVAKYPSINDAEEAVSTEKAALKRSSETAKNFDGKVRRPITFSDQTLVESPPAYVMGGSGTNKCLQLARNNVQRDIEAGIAPCPNMSNEITVHLDSWMVFKIVESGSIVIYASAVASSKDQAMSFVNSISFSK